MRFGANLEGSDNVKGNELKLACQLDEKIGKDGFRHDRSNFWINVQENGNFIIDYAYVDREKRMMNRGAFANAKLSPGDETIDAYDDTNSASRLEFIKYENDDGFEISAKNSYENQFTPVTDSRNLRAGLYSEVVSTSKRGFNADGVETFRHDIMYEPMESDRLNILTTHIRPKEEWGKPEKPSRASFNSIDHLMYSSAGQSSGIESSIYYSRNTNGNTVKIEGYDRGGKFSADSVPLNTEHGTDDIKVTAMIEDLHVSSAE